MYASLQEYLKEKQSNAAHEKRRIKYLETVISRKFDEDTILNCINEITRLNIDISREKTDFTDLYINTAEKISPIVIMHLIHLTGISEKAHFSFYKNVIINAAGIYSEGEVTFLNGIFEKEKEKEKRKSATGKAGNHIPRPEGDSTMRRVTRFQMPDGYCAD